MTALLLALIAPAQAFELVTCRIAAMIDRGMTREEILEAKPTSDLDAVPRRESVIPEYAGAASVDEVIYEGDIEGGPYLTVLFRRPVRYHVIPGSDYRSVRIIVQSVE